MTPLVRRTAVSALGVAVVVVCVLGAEVGVTLSRDYLRGPDAPVADADLAGRGPGAEALRLVVLGDSTAAGVGASSTGTSVAGRLAEAVVLELGTPVTLRSVAVSGAEASDLEEQVDRALAQRPDVALILIGANDVTALTPLDSVRADVAGAVERLRGAGAAVVVGTAPDMGSATAFPRPLRDLAGWRGAAVAGASAQAVRGAGGTAVDLARLTGPSFREAPEVMLSVDRFHPSDEGYALWAQALSPAVLDAAREAVAASA